MNRDHYRRLLAIIPALCLFYSVLAHSDAEAIYDVRLFFGRDIALDKKCGALYVTDTLWSNFVAQQVSTKFDGFTVLDSIGYWKGAKEDTKIIIFTFKSGDDANDNLTKTTTIAGSYAKTFCQDAVMQVYEKNDGKPYRDFIPPTPDIVDD
ncbi:DUF3574 domain-containing protein [Sulfuriflexus mobilis]|uniref:DUF3574 domain-containing protein n=1 Tax=Sulfuriflexus mobilis TaxID=1811807 RepID=UPI000F844352|nr:DUF3574 domain-containing protein [Sulfuriflexus mobilis]